MADKVDDLVGASRFGRIEQFGTLSVTGGEIRLDDSKSSAGRVDLFDWFDTLSGFFRLNFFLLTGRRSNRRGRRRRGLN